MQPLATILAAFLGAIVGAWCQNYFAWFKSRKIRLHKEQIKAASEFLAACKNFIYIPDEGLSSQERFRKHQNQYSEFLNAQARCRLFLPEIDNFLEEILSKAQDIRTRRNEDKKRDEGQNIYSEKTWKKIDDEWSDLTDKFVRKVRDEYEITS
ncbi:MAG: hypothetical protein ABEJ65_02140 [bacterium]